MISHNNVFQNKTSAQAIEMAPFTLLKDAHVEEKKGLGQADLVPGFGYESPDVKNAKLPTNNS